MRQEAGGKREEEEGRSQKKCFYKYEMLPGQLTDWHGKKCVSRLKTVLGGKFTGFVSAWVRGFEYCPPAAAWVKSYGIG